VETEDVLNKVQEAPEVPEPKPKVSKQESSHKIAAILVRGTIGIKIVFKDTLKMLNLRKRNSCVILEKTPSNTGMLNKVKDFITYGEINDATLQELLKTRGKTDPNNKGKLKRMFTLNSPKKGYGKKGIKKAFSVGGSLGYRGQEINDLIKRML